MNFIEWKWSNGEKSERSMRNFNSNPEEKQSQSNYTENQVVNRCLFEGEDMLNIRIANEEQSQLQQFQQLQKQPNKREDTYNRMAEREMMGQIGMNPFLTQNNNSGNLGYIEDLMNQENFLKPISTSIEKER